ncbi:G-type lectin S-receptor-like serine/threonine-protein kinase [Cucumis melo var. makuwa]|uniref:Receptor-like serine/threonine-protein kinase n=2 Tax=Cucumis melo TaxID=3656 RepID=A0A5D3D6Q7_CUCMM|nr:G-type lectin S-receptor-like serine/threonine-protein kinase [Cucumis melo var. makuwa]TYK19238.1 G-type lectin S-receptor-like serine/threonine-protein kinase [Cucumis melo var. makuwa]
MGSPLFIPVIFFFLPLVSSISYTEFIYPNFLASNINFADNGGAFLYSLNKTFKAAIFNPSAQESSFYFCVIHVASNTIIWSANRNDPISSTGEVNLTIKGISITDEDGNLRWSTPQLQSVVYALRLTDIGNLVLLDRSNVSLWESFRYPTDTIVVGQSLPVGTVLLSSISSSDLSSSNYSFSVSSSDALLQWYGQIYWKLSMDPNAFINSNAAVEQMIINSTGLYLLARNSSVVSIQVILPRSNFRIAKLESTGQFIVKSFSSGGWTQEFIGPVDGCRIPFFCGQVGLCNEDSVTNSPSCSCSSSFHPVPPSLGGWGCKPIDHSIVLASPCNSSSSGNKMKSPVFSYLGLGYGIGYFAIDFSEPARYGVNISSCQALCSSECSCLGIFYGNTSGSCYTIKDRLGSIRQSSSLVNDLLGYIKVQVGSTPPSFNGEDKQDFPVAALILLPISGFLLLLFLTLYFLWWRRRLISKRIQTKLGSVSSRASVELDAFFLPGLPRKFSLEELEVATDNFKVQIGSGGFGSVFKGVLHDKSVVAVKKITNLGIEGKKEFCTEIAVIGNIHHTNLVKLKGFCAQGRERFLVYEYMNRGSLDRTLFGSGPVLEWQERYDIALGTARGLSYLHRGCEHKIIHCDVKPENILLHDSFQAKISDFGLSKLLAPEQSGLFTTMRGTRGYLAPEWLTNSAISEKTDVYSYGMVLLEVVSGRKNCTTRSHDHSLDGSDSSGCQSSSSAGIGLVYFPLFALEMHEQGKYLELADPRLEGRVTYEEVKKLVCIALCCVQEEPAIRPSMDAVVSMLEGGIPLSQPRNESLNFLRFYGRRFTEASTIEEEGYQNGSVIYSPANALPSCMSGSNYLFSYMSSQQVSGPR